MLLSLAGSSAVAHPDEVRTLTGIASGSVGRAFADTAHETVSVYVEAWAGVFDDGAGPRAGALARLVFCNVGCSLHEPPITSLEILPGDSVHLVATDPTLGEIDLRWTSSGAPKNVAAQRTSQLVACEPGTPIGTVSSSAVLAGGTHPEHATTIRESYLSGRVGSFVLRGSPTPLSLTARSVAVITEVRWHNTICGEQHP